MQEFRVFPTLVRGVDLYVGNLPTMLAQSLIVYFPVLAITAIAGQVDSGTTPPIVLSSADTDAGTSIVTLVLTVIALCWLEASLTYSFIVKLRSGDFPRLAEALLYAPRVLLRLILLTVAICLLVYFGLILFVVPGILIGTIFWLAVPTLVVERCGAFRALRRSVETTRGYLWRSAGVVVTAVAILSMISIAGAQMADAIFGGFAAWCVIWFIGVVCTGVWIAIMSVGYHDLRMLQEAESNIQASESDA